MRPLKLAVTSDHRWLREPLLQHAYPERNKTWNAEVVWSNGQRDPINLQELLRQMRVDFYFVDLGVLETIQSVFEEEIAPAWENKPNFASRATCLRSIEDAFRSLVRLYLEAGYLRETINEPDHRIHSTGPESSQSLH